jgi:hypothetical protein
VAAALLVLASWTTQAAAGGSPCDTVAVDLRAAGEAVDAAEAFERSVHDLVVHRLVGVAEERAAAVLHLTEVNLRDPENGRAGRMRLRKQVGSRLDLSYHVTVGHAAEQRLRLDLRMVDGVAFRSESDQQGRASTDVVWHWRFR